MQESMHTIHEDDLEGEAFYSMARGKLASALNTFTACRCD